MRAYRRNSAFKRRGNAIREFGSDVCPSDYASRVPVDKALSIITDAVKLAQRQVELGKIFIEGSRVPVLLHIGEKECRLLVRTRFRIDCPPFNMDRIKPKLLTQGGKEIGSEGHFTLGFAPESVDPLCMTWEAALRFPASVEPKDLIGVRLFLRGLHRTLCMPDEDRRDCRSDSVARYCPACASWEALWIEHALVNPGPGSPPCGLPLLGQVYHAGPGDRTLWHCRTCGADWR
jgi:hypothetical protein